MTDTGGGGQDDGDPRKRDYAIVIGIAHYPEMIVGGKPAHLKGPSRDAEQVRDWLVGAGGVPKENVEYVVRSATDDKVADPARDAVVRAFARMWKRFWASGAPLPGKGRRLYVYVSGHGLTADLSHGHLHCSNSSDSSYSTIGPHVAIQDFRKAGFFSEFVIWFDGCMDSTSFIAQAIDYQPPAGNDFDPPAPIFAAYAARPRLKTVEAPDRQGRVRGVFTQALLAGLEGGAADNGQIDSNSLERYLFNSLPKYLPIEAWDNTLVDKQPFFNHTGVSPIVFSTNTQVQHSPIVFDIGAQHDGAEAQLWGRPGGQSLTLMERRVIAGGKVTFSLTKGIYFVLVPQHGLRQGFEVIGGVATKLSEA